jgi:hypothetical protein
MIYSIGCSVQRGLPGIGSVIGWGVALMVEDSGCVYLVTGSMGCRSMKKDVGCYFATTVGSWD